MGYSKSLNAIFVGSQESDVDHEDLNELLDDTRLLKKLKKGKISEEDFDKHMSSAGSSHPKQAEANISDGDGE